MTIKFSHVVGFDDVPFQHEYRDVAHRMGAA
jgi:hypothetical protein